MKRKFTSRKQYEVVHAAFVAGYPVEVASVMTGMDLGTVKVAYSSLKTGYTNRKLSQHLNLIVKKEHGE